MQQQVSCETGSGDGVKLREILHLFTAITIIMGICYRLQNVKHSILNTSSGTFLQVSHSLQSLQGPVAPYCKYS